MCALTVRPLPNSTTEPVPAAECALTCPVGSDAGFSVPIRLVAVGSRWCDMRSHVVSESVEEEVG